jgi:hypothetical protein
MIQGEETTSSYDLDDGRAKGGSGSLRRGANEEAQGGKSGKKEAPPVAAAEQQ